VTKEEPLSIDEEKSKPAEEKPKEKLICPSCRLLYEKMTVCIRCGSALVKEIPSRQGEESKSSDTAEVEKEELHSAHSPEVKKEKLKTDDSPEINKPPLRPTYSPDVKKTPPQVQTSEKRATEEPFEDIEKKGNLQGKGKKKTPRLILEGLSVVILIAIGVFFLWSMYSHFFTHRSPPSASSSGSVIPSTTSPPASPTAMVGETQEGEKKQPEESSITNESGEVEGIKDLLEKVRQANLQKNIDLFMSCYSTDFKDREGKRRATLESWKKFDYLDLSYDLKEHSISTDTAQAYVEWLMRISPKIGGKPQESKTVLDVTLKREDGSWRIKETRLVS